MLRIMVDSASDFLPGDKLIDFFVPVSVNIGGQDYRDGIDLDKDRFYAMLCTVKEFPRTSQPSPEIFFQHFIKVQEAGDELIYFALSSALSGTYQSAKIAKEMCGYEGIHIVDSLCATHLIAYLVQQARKLQRLGLPASEIVKSCEELKGRLRIYAGVDVLEYLRRGGRLSGAAAAMGTLAGIKPILSINTAGCIAVVGKAMGFCRAVQTIIEKMSRHSIDMNYPICTLYSFGEENCIALEQTLAAQGIQVESRAQVGPTIGAHVGPGLYGIIFVEK